MSLSRIQQQQLHSFSNEQILFRKDYTKGIWKPKIVKSYIITTHRVITTVKGKGVEQLMLDEISDVLPMEMHSASAGDFQMVGLRNRTGFRYNVGGYRNKGRTVGNVVFLSGGGGA